MAQIDHTITPASDSHVTVRMSDRSDARTLARLAALDSAAVPVGPTLLAEVDGEAVAALPVAGAGAVADPFRRTSAALDLLALRAAQIRGQARPARSPAAYGERLRGRIRSPRAVPSR